MVRQLLSRITAPVRGLHQAAYVLAGLTLASQVLALLRDRLFAHLFGAGEILDLYYAAFRIPDLVYALIVSLVSAYVLIPRLATLTENGGKVRAREFISQAASFLFVASGLISLVLFALAPTLLFGLFPGFADSPQADDFVLLTRLLLLQPIILGLSSVLGSVTQLKRRFFLYALSPVLYNVGIIAGTFFLYPEYGLMGIGIGVIGGALAHLAVNVPIVRRAGLAPRPAFPRPGVIWSIMRDSVPRSLALGFGSFTMLALVALAARTGEGSVAIFTLATNLEAVPLALIGAAYATAAFPVLAEQVGKKEHAAFRETVLTAARHIIFWSAVITVLAIVLRAHIVRVLLGSGAFDWSDTRLTAAVFAVLIVGLLAQSVVLLASRAFYAAGRSWNPLIIQIFGAVLAIASAYALLRLANTDSTVRFFFENLLRIEGVPGASILFIALGATLGQLVMAVIALATLSLVVRGVASRLLRPLLEGLGAAILGGAAAYGALALMGTLAPLTRLAIVVAEGTVAGMVGLFVAGTVLALLENREFHDLAASLKKLTSTDRAAAALTPYDPTNDRPDT